VSARRKFSRFSGVPVAQDAVQVSFGEPADASRRLLFGNFRLKKLEEGTIIGNLCQEIRSSGSDIGDWK